MQHHRFRAFKSLAIVSLSLLVVATGSVVSTRADPTAAQKPGDSDGIFAHGPCDTADVGDISKDSNSRSRQLAAEILMGRIGTCHFLVTKFWTVQHMVPSDPWVEAQAASPVDPPQCTPLGIREKDPLRLYFMLSNCATFIKSLPTPPAAPSPPPLLASRPTFYVFAAGGDGPTNLVLTRWIADRLTLLTHGSPAGRPPNAWLKTVDMEGEMNVLTRSDWTSPSSFALQCQLDPMTRGALMLEATTSQTVSSSFVIILVGGTRVAASVEMLGCGYSDHRTTITPLTLAALGKPLEGKSNADVSLQLGLLSSLGSLLAKNTTTTTTTTTTPTTVTASPAPAPASSVATVQTKTALGGYLLAGTAASALSNATVPGPSSSAELTHASVNFVDSLFDQLLRDCTKTYGEASLAGRTPGMPTDTIDFDRYRSQSAVAAKAAFEFLTQCEIFENFNLHQGSESGRWDTLVPICPGSTNCRSGT